MTVASRKVVFVNDFYSRVCNCNNNDHSTAAVYVVVTLLMHQLSIFNALNFSPELVLLIAPGNVVLLRMKKVYTGYGLYKLSKPPFEKLMQIVDSLR